MNDQVQILLATYNGEKYLSEQLSSLIRQTYPNWRIIVRDDGSTDGTLEILESFEKENPEKIEIYRDNGQRLTAHCNFLWLIKKSTADFVMFCDQDDVWNPDKIERCLSELVSMERMHGKKTPLLVHHDVSIINSQGGMEHGSYHRYFHISAENTGIKRLLLMNAVHGMSMMANRALIDKALPHPDMIESHDQYLSMVAELFGKIRYIPESLAQYRIHETNTSGIGNYYSGIFNGVLSAAPRIQKKIAQRCAAAESFEQRHADRLSESQSRLLKDFSKIPNKTWIARKYDILRHGPCQVLNERSLLFLIHS